jgi:predicted DNA-binding transcriptional regulator AlpA
MAALHASTPHSGITAKFLPDAPASAAATYDRVEQLLTREQVLRATTLSKTQMYDMIRAGDFPPPIALSEKRRAWRASQIARWQAERPIAALSEAA